MMGIKVHRTRAKQLVANHRRGFIVATVILSVIMGITYIGLTNNVATQGYHLSALQRQLSEAQTQSESLNFDLLAAQSLPRVQAQAGSITLKPVAGIEYLATSGNTVALR